MLMFTLLLHREPDSLDLSVVDSTNQRISCVESPMKAPACGAGARYATPSLLTAERAQPCRVSIVISANAVVCCRQACAHVSEVHGASQKSSELQILRHSPSDGSRNPCTVLQQPQSVHW